MIKKELLQKYHPTIGIECHVQLKTISKLFSGSANGINDALPNSQTNHIDFGLPGALPVTNSNAIDLAIRAGYALHTTAQKFSKFDRKHYFYPDLPMGYQITQYDFPIIKGGYIDIKIDNKIKRIGITRAHLESDAGKSLHPAGSDYSLVDLNRAGSPLLEIVSEPDMHSAIEARIYAFELFLAMKYAEVSEANLFYGNMRFDVNVSVSSTSKLGVRTETKNLNSFRSIEKTVEYEIERQIKILEKGGVIKQETRGYNDAKQITIVQRIKENADDYRYMPDPDIPPILITDDHLKRIHKTMPVLPDVWRSRLSVLGFSDLQINLLLMAQTDTDNHLLDFINNNLSDLNKAKTFVNWIINIELPIYQNNDENNFKDNILVPNDREKLFQDAYLLKEANKINSSKLTALLETIIKTNIKIDNLEQWATDNGYLQNSNEEELTRIIQDILSTNPKVVSDIMNGEVKAIGFLVGQVMSQTKGQANPKIVQDIIKQSLKL